MYDASRHYEPLPIMISPMTDEDSWGDDTLYMAFCHGFPDMVNDSAQHSARSAAIRLCALGAARPQGHVSVVSQISASNSNRLECDPAYLHIYLPHICSVRFIHPPSRNRHLRPLISMSLSCPPERKRSTPSPVGQQRSAVGSSWRCTGHWTARSLAPEQE